MSRKYNMKNILVVLLAVFAVAMAGIFLSVKKDA